MGTKNYRKFYDEEPAPWRYVYWLILFFVLYVLWQIFIR